MFASRSRTGAGGSCSRTPSSPARTIAPRARYGLAVASAARYSRRICSAGSAPASVTNDGIRRSASRLASATHTPPTLQRWGASRSAETGLGAVIATRAAGVPEDPRREPAAELAQRARSRGVVQQRTAVGVAQAEMDVDAVACRVGIQQRSEARALAVSARRVAHDLPHHDAAVGGGQAVGGRHRDLELVRGVLGEEQFGLCPGLQQRPHQFGAERVDPSLCLERERCSGRCVRERAGTRARSSR